MAVELVSRTETSAYLRILREGAGQVDCQLYRVSDDAYITSWSWAAGTEWLYPVGSYINFNTVDAGVTLTENTNYEIYYRAGNDTWKSFYFKTLPDTYTRTITLSGAVRVEHTRDILLAGQVQVRKSYSDTISGQIRITRSEQTLLPGQVHIEKTRQSNMSGQVTVRPIMTTNIGGQARIEKTSSTTISGTVAVAKIKSTNISGSVRIRKNRQSGITGQVRIRITAPEKLPQTWRKQEPEKERQGWSEPEKQQKEWSTVADKTAISWEETPREKDAQNWKKSADKPSQEWNYQEYELSSQT